MSITRVFEFFCDGCADWLRVEAKVKAEAVYKARKAGWRQRRWRSEPGRCDDLCHKCASEKKGGES